MATLAIPFKGADYQARYIGSVFANIALALLVIYRLLASYAFAWTYALPNWAILVGAIVLVVVNFWIVEVLDDHEHGTLKHQTEDRLSIFHIFGIAVWAACAVATVARMLP